MADAGFFRGTSAEQDNRFLDKQKKLLKSMRFDDVLNKKVDMDKVNLDVIKPWITKKLIEILGVEDDVVMQYVLNMLESEKSPDPRFMQINITGFLQSKNAREFMKELWSLLLSAQENIGGIPSTFLEKKKEEIKQRKLEQERIQANLQKYQGDQQQTEPDSTATDENVGNENGSAAATGDITEEIRKAKEVAQALAGKDANLQKYQGDQQQTEPDSTATDENVGNENGSGAATGDITEEIRKAKEVAQALAGKDNSPKHGYKKSKRNSDNSDSDDSDDGGAARKKKEATKNTEENAERAEPSSAVKVKKEREVEERSPSKLLQPKWRSRLLSSAARPVDRDKPGWDKEHMQNVALTKTPERASSGSRKGSGRAGSANMPSTGGSRNNSAESESGRVDSGGSRRSANRSAGRTKLITSDNDDSFSFGGAKEVDATYADPLGEAPARPKTAGRQRPQQAEDEFGDKEIGDDLLPE